jgi:hypothetical protein
MNVIDALTAEHGVFLSQLEHLEQSVNRATPADKLRVQFELFAVGLRRHAKLEDDLVFGPLKRKLGLHLVLHDEHPLISDLVSRVLEKGDPGELSGLISHFIRALRRHFSNEENFKGFIGQDCGEGPKGGLQLEPQS